MNVVDERDGRTTFVESHPFRNDSEAVPEFAQQPEPAPDEGESEAHALTDDELATLQMLSDGGFIWADRSAFTGLLDRGLIEPATPLQGAARIRGAYAISDAGRMALAEAASDAIARDREHLILGYMADGAAICQSHKGRLWMECCAIIPMRHEFEYLLAHGLLSSASEYAGTSVRYTISAAGRALLASSDEG